MLRVRECVLLFLILATALSLEDKELKKEELKDEGQKKKELEREELKKEELKKEGLKNDELDEFSSSRIGRYFFDIFGGANKCQNPENCPPHACRLDDAVVHGFCCGCARLSDRVPVECPPWLQCPISQTPLCDDYNYMMDCCC